MWLKLSRMQHSPFSDDWLVFPDWMNLCTTSSNVRLWEHCSNTESHVCPLTVKLQVSLYHSMNITAQNSWRYQWNCLSNFTCVLSLYCSMREGMTSPAMMWLALLEALQAAWSSLALGHTSFRSGSHRWCLQSGVTSHSQLTTHSVDAVEPDSFNVIRWVFL